MSHFGLSVAQELTWGRRSQAFRLWKQSDDFSKALEIFAPSCENNGLYMVAEDDFEWCDHTEKWVNVLKMARSGNFTAIKLSYGLGGVIAKCSDLPALQEYMLTYKNSWPIDALLASFHTKSTNEAAIHFGSRPYLTFRYILGEHMATASESTLGRNPQGAGNLLFHIGYVTTHELLSLLLSLCVCVKRTLSTLWI